MMDNKDIEYLGQLIGDYINDQTKDLIEAMPCICDTILSTQCSARHIEVCNRCIKLKELKEGK